MTNSCGIADCYIDGPHMHANCTGDDVAQAAWQKIADLEQQLAARDERIRELEQLNALQDTDLSAVALKLAALYKILGGKAAIRDVAQQCIDLASEREQQLRAAQDTIASKDVQLNDVKQQMQDARNVASDRLKAAQERLAEAEKAMTDARIMLENSWQGRYNGTMEHRAFEFLKEYFAKHGTVNPRHGEPGHRCNVDPNEPEPIL